MTSMMTRSVRKTGEGRFAISQVAFDPLTVTVTSTATEYTIREVCSEGLDERGFVVEQLNQCEFDSPPNVYVFVGREGAFSNPTDGNAGEILDAVTALLKSG